MSFLRSKTLRTAGTSGRGDVWTHCFEPQGASLSFSNDMLGFGVPIIPKEKLLLLDCMQIPLISMQMLGFLRVGAPSSHRNLPVMLAPQSLISRGVPQATILPPSSPPPGPMSTM